MEKKRWIKKIDEKGNMIKIKKRENKKSKKEKDYVLCVGINIGGAKKAGKGKRTCLNQIGCFASWGFKPVSQLS